MMLLPARGWVAAEVSRSSCFRWLQGRRMSNGQRRVARRRAGPAGPVAFRREADHRPPRDGSCRLGDGGSRARLGPHLGCPVRAASPDGPDTDPGGRPGAAWPGTPWTSPRPRTRARRTGWMPASCWRTCGATGFRCRTRMTPSGSRQRAPFTRECPAWPHRSTHRSTPAERQHALDVVLPAIRQAHRETPRPDRPDPRRPPADVLPVIGWGGWSTKGNPCCR